MESIILSVIRSALVWIVAALVGLNATADDNLTNESVVALINDLVLTAKDTFVMEGRSYYTREGMERISRATEQLTSAGKAAWPQLFAHLRDKRASTPSAEVLGRYDVGMKCYYILRFQIMDMPRGYPYQKTLAYDQLSFRPGIDVWLTQRRDRSLDEIRYEVVAILIDMEDYAGNRQAVDLLEPHLAVIAERIKLASQSQRQQTQAIPR